MTVKRNEMLGDGVETARGAAIARPGEARRNVDEGDARTCRLLRRLTERVVEGRVAAEGAGVRRDVARAAGGDGGVGGGARIERHATRRLAAGDQLVVDGAGAGVVVHARVGDVDGEALDEERARLARFADEEDERGVARDQAARRRRGMAA